MITCLVLDGFASKLVSREAHDALFTAARVDVVSGKGLVVWIVIRSVVIVSRSSFKNSISQPSFFIRWLL